MKPYPLSIHTFSDLIQGGFLYVDKTVWIHRIVSIPKGAFFLSRPRRFGKSLLLSTLKAVFLAQRDLFRGLAIEKLPYDWKAYPVVHLDLGDKQAGTSLELERILCETLDDCAAPFDVVLTRKGAASRFRELITRLGSRGKVVVLVDEYDKPILGNLQCTDEVKKIRDLLKGFYSVLKSADQYLRFVLLTGVSKFSEVSVFSDLNNLKDLSMDPAYADLLGYTEDELERCFGDAIRLLAEREGRTYEEILQKIRGWYNGYRFSRSSTSVYNPVSVMSLLETGEFRCYWFETGTPAFLIDLVRSGDVSVAEIPSMEVSERAFSAYEVDHLEALPLLYQTGYLTIKSYDAETATYRLDFPNDEVKDSFSECLVERYSGMGQGEVGSHLLRLKRALEAGNVTSAMEAFKVFFANIPYDIRLSNERYYQTVFYVVFLLLGHRIAVEERTDAGRIDAVLETAKKVYVFEFKLRGTAEAAMTQIREKRYHEKYLGGGKPVVLVGAAFDEKTRNIGSWVVEDAR